MKKTIPKRPSSHPKIYAYTFPTSEYEGLVKIGYTTRSVRVRIKEQYVKKPQGVKSHKLLLEESSIRNDGTVFIDKDVHRILKNHGIKNKGGEWFKCTKEEVLSAITSLREKAPFETKRNKSFRLRPEQINAINKTCEYFKKYKLINGRAPHFLWNCKMRFGKTFATYHLAKKMKWDKVLVLTFKPSVENSWKEDLYSHTSLRGWQFISKDTNSYKDIDKSKPFVCFASFQDFLGKNPNGGIKIKNKWAHKIKWDCIVLDEYHYGSWRKTAKELYQSEEKSEQSFALGEGIDYWDEKISPLKTNHYLYLSGTPFRAIESGEFVENQIFNWTYSDEQKAKQNCRTNDNPYKSLPRMVMMTYKLPEKITYIASKGEFDEFDLNIFFKAKGQFKNAVFEHKNEVQKWINLIRGTDINYVYDSLKLGKSKLNLPFEDTRMLQVLSHTFWFLPSVASCHAMKNLLSERQNSTFFSDYEIIVCAGKQAGIGVNALNNVHDKMQNPLKSKSITLSCGKLTTGVTVKPWTGIFMLRNTTSPETYFQSAFRVQSPWTAPLEDEGSFNKEIIYKEECYVFDFAPNRTLRLVTDYCCRLNLDESNPKAKINEFLKFLPIYCLDGSEAIEIDANEAFKYSEIGTTGSQLAKKFESSRLVNVDDDTLNRLVSNPNLLRELESIERFRKLKPDVEKIITKSDVINRMKKSNKNSKKKINKEQLELRKLRQRLQEKLLKLSTRIPVFMYLTDYREETLKDVITKIEPTLFNKVTGISVETFDKMLSVGLFNSTLMNSAVYAFKNYENSSLAYAGGFTNYNPKKIGLFDTKISNKDLQRRKKTSRNL